MDPLRGRLRGRLPLPLGSLAVPLVAGLGAIAFLAWKPGVARSLLGSPRAAAFALVVGALVLGAGWLFVLNFFRGHSCPKEQAFFRGLASFQEEVEVAYTRMVSVSVDPPGELAAFRNGLGARWTFFSDAERTWIEQLGLRETTDTVYRP